MTASTLPDHAYGSLAACHQINGQFKRHKLLPRPKTDLSANDNRPMPAISDLAFDTAVPLRFSGSQTPNSPRTLKHQPRRIGSGPDLPPTPPNYSRISPGSHAAQTSSPSPPIIITKKSRAPSKLPPATPPDQRGPPTPDVTPPHPINRPRALRPLALDCGVSRTGTNTTDSRTASFRTAREEPFSSEDEAATSIRTVVASLNPSQTTVLRPHVSVSGRVVEPEALDSALERLKTSSADAYTFRTRGELTELDGEWSTLQRGEGERNGNAGEVVSMRRHRPNFETPRTLQLNGTKRNILEERLVAPANATKAVQDKDMSLIGVATARPSPKASPQLTPLRQRTGSGTSDSETPKTMDPRRSSGLSSHSTSSTVIEALLVDSPSSFQRNRTLRHVRKRRDLKEPNSGQQSKIAEVPETSPSKSLKSNLRKEQARRHNSCIFTTSTNYMTSGKARRELWRTGAIPVVVIPDRQSSQKLRSREPSLRSSSSRRSKRTRSVGSSSIVRSPLNSEELPLDRNSRWDRSASISDGLDHRTIDFPPSVPGLSSSLSAPTSRATSPTASLTSECTKAMNEMNSPHEKLNGPKTVAPLIVTRTSPIEVVAPAVTVARVATPVAQVPVSPIISVQSPRSSQTSQTPRSDKNHGHEAFGAECLDDTVSSRKYSSRATPFSIISLETNWTVPEISEALAVQMYPHQNSSIVRINHCAKPLDAPPHAEKSNLEEVDLNEPPLITAINPEGGVMTPAPQKSLEEVDSPLRNPRSPPDPPAHLPAINFIPATPSGLTPAEERLVQLGNFYELAAEKPSRRPSLVRRALSRRRHSISYPPAASKQRGFLTRTFSLSRNDRKSPNAEPSRFLNPDMGGTYGDKEDRPAEQDKLHPYWRPQWGYDTGDCDCSSCRNNSGRGEESYRYPMVDNRPRLPKRELSAKVRNTFAILPARQEFHYHMDDGRGPERRTIRRTPSGNLKVMRRQSSDNSLEEERAWPHADQRPVSAGNSRKGFWWGHGFQRHHSTRRLRRSSSLSARFEEFPSLSRKWSERRRERRTQELRHIISGPREVRDGVVEVIRKRTI